MALEHAADGDGNRPVFLRNNHDHGIGDFTRADTRAVTRAEVARQVRIVAQRHDTAGRGHTSASDNDSAVVQRRVFKEKVAQQLLRQLCVNNGAGLEIVVKRRLALKYEQNAYEDAARRCPKQDSFVATPDGLGNVSSVDILREQVLVRLDGQNESPKRYRTCEIHVLRNGKGSRDGIELPTTLPKRYQEPPEEEPQLTLNFFSSAKPIVPPEQWPAPVAKADAPASDDEEKEKRRSRRGGRGHRGGRGRGKGSGEGGEKSAAPKSENTPQKGGDKPTEKRSERPARGDKPSSERPPRNPDKNGERRAPRQSKPNSETPDAPKTPRLPRPPKAEGAIEGGESKPRRRSHRGGRGRRRSGGQGGEAPAPKNEA